MGYRDTGCARCESPALRACPRCGDRVCEKHAQCKHAWCTFCEEEWEEDIDFARARATFGGARYVADQQDVDQGVAMINLVVLAWNVISGPLRRRRAVQNAQDEFTRRPRDEIEKWRAMRRTPER